jgi:hypothetical protein
MEEFYEKHEKSVVRIENVRGQEIQKPIKVGKIIKSPKPGFRLTRQSSTGRAYCFTYCLIN